MHSDLNCWNHLLKVGIAWICTRKFWIPLNKTQFYYEKQTKMYKISHIITYYRGEIL